MLVVFVGCKDDAPTHQEQAQQIEAGVQAKIEKVRNDYFEACEGRVMKAAIPVADSMIADFYTRDLQEADSIPVKPSKPEAPKIEIPDFPLDSFAE